MNTTLVIPVAVFGMAVGFPQVSTPLSSSGRHWSGTMTWSPRFRSTAATSTNTTTLSRGPRALRAGNPQAFARPTTNLKIHGCSPRRRTHGIHGRGASIQTLCHTGRRNQLGSKGSLVAKPRRRRFAPSIEMALRALDPWGHRGVHQRESLLKLSAVCGFRGAAIGARFA
jgi:hypothetical protein